MKYGYIFQLYYANLLLPGSVQAPLVLWALRPQWDEAGNILAQSVLGNPIQTWLPGEVPGESLCPPLLGQDMQGSVACVRWADGSRGNPLQKPDIHPVRLCPSLNGTFRVIGSAWIIGSAGSIACSSLNGFKLVDLIRALLLYPRAHPRAGGGIPVPSGMCLQRLWGFHLECQWWWVWKCVLA